MADSIVISLHYVAKGAITKMERTTIDANLITVTFVCLLVGEQPKHDGELEQKHELKVLVLEQR